MITPCKINLLLMFLISSEITSPLESQAQTILKANGDSENTYSIINSVLGGTAYEVPDCSHTNFGNHIRQKNDPELKRPVFVFYLHVDPDNDRCQATDRQRTEIKTYGPSPDYIKGFEGDEVNFSWNVKLASGFQPSSKFTHIHQIKAGDGDDSSPIITLTPRKKGDSGKILQLIHVDSTHTETVLQTTDLKPFLGQWVHVNEMLTYGSEGNYSVTITRLKDNKQLFTYTSDNIDLWRDGTTFCRPKWGLYRSKKDKGSLRNEAVLYDTFCLAKGNDTCI